jgi:hypothetical protein
MVLPDGVRLYVVTPVGHDAWLDNKIAAVYVWLFQDLFHNRARWMKCNGMKNKSPFGGAFIEPSDGLEPSTPSL